MSALPADVPVLAPFKPLAWQPEPWRCQAKVMLLEGSAGGGKSRLAAEKMHAFCLKYAGAMALAVRKNRESMTNSTVLFLDRTVIAGDARVRPNPSNNRFVYANGSVLAYGGMKDDQQREQIRSIGLDAGVDIIWMEEAHLFSEADYEELLARLRGKAAPWRQLILTTNPDSDQHWIYRRLILRGEATVFRSSAADNTYNPDDYAETLDKLTGVRRARLARGQWVSAEGAVYDEYSAHVHLIDPFPVPGEWRRFVSIDFGFVNPFVAQFWAVDGDGRMYLYREVYMSQRLVEDHARELKKLAGDERIEFVVSDHDAEDRATLERHWRKTIAAHKDVSPGIQAVQARLRVQRDGKPRLFLMRGALVELDTRLEDDHKPTSTAAEITAYVWQRGADGKPLKEAPVKVDDHGADAMRYAVAQLDLVKRRPMGVGVTKWL